MTVVAVILLAALWLGVFVPALIRARQDTSPIVSVGAFRRGMRALSGGQMAGAGGRWILTPAGPGAAEDPKKRATRRRRRMLSGLLVAALLTLVMGLIPDLRWLLRLHIALDFLIVGYVLFLVQARQQRDRYIPRHAPMAESPPALEEDRFLKAGQF